jgi:hypothetical protein
MYTSIHIHNYECLTILLTEIFNENHIYEIRKVIYEMFSKREHVTVDTLLQKLRDKHLFEHSRSRLHRLMLENGFKF